MRNLLILLTLVLVACGPDDKHIAIDGRLLNLNQGEFFVYSPDGATQGIDTIDVAGGRFEFTTECQRRGTVCIVMAGGQEIPVFVAPGHSYSVKGDVQNLKAIEVNGGDDNKLMNSFRKAVAARQPGETPVSEVRQFVMDNPSSDVAMYLIGRYLVTDSPDQSVVMPLLSRIKDARKDDTAVEVFVSRISELAKVSNGAALPALNLTDIDGKAVSDADLRRGVVILTSFATWDYESLNQMRRIHSTLNDRGLDSRIIGISFDPSRKQARDYIGNDISNYTIICDERMTETPAAQTLAMNTTGMVIIVRDGKIVERSLNGEPLYEKLRKM